MQQHFVCQFILGKTVEPEPIPDFTGYGGCPDGWYRYRTRCFQYNGLENGSKNRKNFTDAEEDCKEKGGNLASVYDEYYNCEFIYLFFCREYFKYLRQLV